VATGLRPVLRRFRMNNLRKIRKLRGLSQAHVADALGTTGATISRHENGKVDIQLSDLARYAALYRCTFGELLDNAPLLDDRDRATIQGYLRLLPASKGTVADVIHGLAKGDMKSPVESWQDGMHDGKQKKLHRT
jgi:transcriptional regulator with XRE-family HTH domain